MTISSKSIKTMKDQLAKTQAENNKPLKGKYDAIIEKVTAKTYKSGAFGFEFVYALTGEKVKGRKIWENVVMRKKDGTTPQYAESTLIRRLSAAGISDEEIPNMNLPEKSDETGDLDKLHGASVVVKLDVDVFNEQVTTKVKGVYAPSAN